MCVSMSVCVRECPCVKPCACVYVRTYIYIIKHFLFQRTTRNDERSICQLRGTKNDRC